jgi:DNA-binding GntR family transcriptional regulator
MLESIKSLSPISRGILRSDTTACLVQAVLKGQLKQGHKLVVRKLAEPLQISATPYEKRWWNSKPSASSMSPPNQSAIIRSFGAKELSEVYHLRGLLEGEAARLACPNLPRTHRYLLPMIMLLSDLMGMHQFCCLGTIYHI